MDTSWCSCPVSSFVHECKGLWWDKDADADKHIEIFPFHPDIMGAHKGMKQNPGYDGK